MSVKLLPHQEKAVQDLSNGKVLVGSVGSGKTVTALVYFFTKVMGGVVGDFDSVRHPMDLYVFTTARKRESWDWQRWAARLGIGTLREVSVKGIKLTVESYNNIHKFKEIKGAFIILDEQRMVGSGNWTKSFIKMARSNSWIMLSATPGDRWEDYIPLFVANGFYKNRSEFKREHCIYSYYGRYPKLEGYLGVGKLVRLRNSILVEMPFKSHTTRHVRTVPVGYDIELYKKVVKDRWHVYENRPLKDASELFSVMRKVVNSDQSRLRSIQTLMDTHPRMIVFYNFDYELEILRKLNDQKEINKWTSTLEMDENSLNGSRKPLVSSLPYSNSNESNNGMGGIEFPEKKVQIAEWNGHKHEPIPDCSRWVYLVQYVAGSEAWNCTETDTMVFYSLTYSYKNFEQAQGRIDRLNTPFLNLNYFVLLSDSPIDRAVVKSLKNKKNFNEKVYTQNSGFLVK